MIMTRDHEATCWSLPSGDIGKVLRSRTQHLYALPLRRKRASPRLDKYCTSLVLNIITSNLQL